MRVYSWKSLEDMDYFNAYFNVIISDGSTIRILASTI